MRSELMGEVTITLKNGKECTLEKEDYYGFHTRPMSWEDVKKKFRKLTRKMIGREMQQMIIDVIENFEEHQTKDLIRLLVRAGKQQTEEIRSTTHYKKAG